MSITSGYYSGKDGRLSIGATPSSLDDIAKVSQWSLSASLDTLETTTLGDYERYYIPGLKSASGAATVLYYEPPDKLTTGTSNVAGVLNRIITLTDLTEQNTKLYFRLLWNSGGANPARDRRAIEFYAHITQAGLEMATGSVMSVNLSFQMTGDYTVVGI